MKTSNTWSKVCDFLEEIENQKQLQADIKELKETHQLTDEEIEMYIDIFLGIVSLEE